MQKQKRNRALGAVLLAVALCITGLVPALTAAAVNTVDTARQDCTLAVQTPQQGFDELREPGCSFEVKAYFVASMNADGSVGTEGQGTGDFAGEDLSAYGSDATVDELEGLAGSLKELVEESGLEPAQTIEVAGGKGSINGLPVGLYLLLPEAVGFGAYEYQFAPSLVTLPTTEPIENPGYQEGGPEQDRYLYNLTYNAKLTLKPERVDLVGMLRIEKELLRYRADLGPVSFVFEVKAEKAQDGQAQTVYSNVVSIAFSAPGLQHVDLANIPAGAKVTVTEVYSGASYAQQGAQSWSIEPMPANTAIDATTTARFTNDYDGTQGWGASVVNRYTYNPDAQAWDAPTGGPAQPAGAA